MGASSSTEDEKVDQSSEVDVAFINWHSASKFEVGTGIILVYGLIATVLGVRRLQKRGCRRFFQGSRRSSSGAVGGPYHMEMGMMGRRSDAIHTA